MIIYMNKYYDHIIAHPKQSPRFEDWFKWYNQQALIDMQTHEESCA